MLDRNRAELAGESFALCGYAMHPWTQIPP